MAGRIRVRGLSKGFALRNPGRPRTLKERIVSRQRDVGVSDFFIALDDVSLTVNAGELVGIIGRNGAGKSTLLRLVGNIGRPDRGSIEVDGSVGALLELGAGFHPELTGRENVFVAGIVAGLTREQVARRFSEIVEFAELESFIDNPLRTYSSGMQLRLAFSINVHTSAQVLLIDEVLAVGDLAFQRKCVERIAQFKREGCAILIVSHDLNQIKTVCDRVIWLRDGKIVAAGEAQEVVGKYERAMMAETRRRGSKVAVRQTRGGRELRLGETRWGTMEMQILDVCFLDADDQPIEELPSGQALTVRVLYAPAGAALRSPIFSVSISDTHGTICVDTNTSQLDVPDVDSEGSVRVCFDRLDLVGGEYFVDVGLFATDWGHVYDYQWHVYPLVVRDTSTGKGLVNFPHRWQLGSRADD